MPEARLLVVDDEPNIVELLAAGLRYTGFEVATARSGNEALRVAAEFAPDLLVLDVMMPGLDGFAVVPGCARTAAPRPFGTGLTEPPVRLAAPGGARVPTDVVDGTRPLYRGPSTKASPPLLTYRPDGI